MTKKILLFLAAAGLALSFSGCHATQGLGEDIEHLGGEIQQEAAEETRY